MNLLLIFSLTSHARTAVLVQQPAAAEQRQTKAGCPPPVGQFLVMRERPRRVRKRIGEEIAQISVRENNYFGRTRCSIPEDIQDTAAGVGGLRTVGRPLRSLLRVVEEELEEVEEVRGAPSKRRRLKSCTLFLAAADFPESQLEVTVLLLTELIPGLAAYCDTPLTAQAHITVQFCQEEASQECTVLPRDDR